jgi:hypothetical protein
MQSADFLFYGAIAALVHYFIFYYITKTAIKEAIASTNEALLEQNQLLQEMLKDKKK